MVQSRRIAVTVPDSLLREVEALAAMERSRRSVLILEALRIYVEERKKRDMREQLKRGYETMARINLALAEEGPIFESAQRVRSRSRENE